MTKFERQPGAVDLEARLAAIDAALSELVDLWHQGSDRRDELGRELVEERAKNLELQRKQVPIEKALLACHERMTELERDLADLTGDLAEREHLVEELQQQRTLREAERDRLLKSRWRKFGKAIGVVKPPDWERALDE